MVTSRDFEVRHGRAMSYELYRPSPRDAGMPVLFIHDWRSSPEMYHGLVSCLDSTGLRCILPHFTSDGVSGKDPAAHSWHEPLLVLIDELHLARFGLVAFGMFGGSIARSVIHVLGFQRCTFISLLSPGPCLIDTPARDAFWNMLPAETRERILDLPPDALDTMIHKAVDLFDVKDSALSRGELSTDLHALSEEIITLSREGMRAHGTCPVPAQIICGELDEVVPLELAFKTVRSFGEVDVSVIPLAGHYFLADFHEEAARCMQEFLDGQVARSRG